MRAIDDVSANFHLSTIHMKLGQWNEIQDPVGKTTWISRTAPSGARELLTFAQFIATWVPHGQWKLLQIDNSTRLDAFQINFLRPLVPEGKRLFDRDIKNTYLFEFDECEADNTANEICIISLIFSFLLFNAHVSIVSKNSAYGEKLSIHDGVAYLGCRDGRLEKAHEILAKFDAEPLGSPDWIVGFLNRNLSQP